MGNVKSRDQFGCSSEAGLSLDFRGAITLPFSILEGDVLMVALIDLV